MTKAGRPSYRAARYRLRVAFYDPFSVLLSDDLPRLVAFYRDLLGFAETYRFPASGAGQPEFVVLGSGPARFGFGRADGLNLHGRQRSAHTGNRVEMCVYADDVDEAVGALRTAGVEVLSEPADQPWGERAAYVADPDGNPVLIVAPVNGGGVGSPPDR